MRVRRGGAPPYSIKHCTGTGVVLLSACATHVTRSLVVTPSYEQKPCAQTYRVVTVRKVHASNTHAGLHLQQINMKIIKNTNPELFAKQIETRNRAVFSFPQTVAAAWTYTDFAKWLKTATETTRVEKQKQNERGQFLAAGGDKDLSVPSERGLPPTAKLVQLCTQFSSFDSSADKKSFARQHRPHDRRRSMCDAEGRTCQAAGMNVHRQSLCLEFVVCSFVFSNGLFTLVLLRWHHRLTGTVCAGCEWRRERKNGFP